MPHEDAAVAAITVECAAEFSDARRRLYPASSFRIELAQGLKLEIFFLRQKLDAHGYRHPNRAVVRLMFLPGLQRIIVVTKTQATIRGLRGTNATARSMLRTAPDCQMPIRMVSIGEFQRRK